MSFAGLSLSPPPARAQSSSSPSPSRTMFGSSPSRVVSPKEAPAGFSQLEVSPQPTRVASTMSSLSLGGFTTPKKSDPSRSPISKSTSKKAAPKFASMSLGPDSAPTTPKTPKASSTSGTPGSKKRINLNGALSIVSFAKAKNSGSPRKTPSPRKVSFLEDASFLSASGSTPKPSRGPTPKSSPSKAPTSRRSAPIVPADLSPASIEELSISPIPDTPSEALIPAEEDEESTSFLESPSKVAETSIVFQSPSKVDTTMHDVTMMSDYHGTSSTPQTYSFATTDLSDVAQKLCGPFKPELFEQVEYSSALAAPRPFQTRRFVQKRPRVTRKKQLRKKQRFERMFMESAIVKQVDDSRSIEELEAGPMFRTIAAKGKLAYALCPRKRQKTEDISEDEEPYWIADDPEWGVSLIIEARRVVRNGLYNEPIGLTVPELRQQYQREVRKHGEAIHPIRSKRSYEGAPKRAYSNDLLTHSIMGPLLRFPMPELSFEFVLQEAINAASKARGEKPKRSKNPRQHIAIFGEPEVPVIEEEEEPQSPTPKLPHFPSTATHHSNAQRKDRLDQGAETLRSKLAELQSVPEPSSSPGQEPLSSPIGPGFTFEVPSFISTPSTTKASDIAEDQAQEVAEEVEEEPEAAPSPIVVFKNRTPGTPNTTFKKRKSLPVSRRLSFSGPLRRASLPAAGSVQLPAVHNPSAEVDLASRADAQASPAVTTTSPTVIPTSVDEPPDPVVHNPSTEVDLASRVDAPTSPAPSSSPSSVVVDVRENPDIFGSSQDRPGSPIQTLASLARVFVEAKEMADAKVVVKKEDGRLIVRFKLSDELAARFEDAPTPASPAAAVSPAPAPALATSPSPSPAPAPAPVDLAVPLASPSPVSADDDSEEETVEEDDEDQMVEDQNEEEDEVDEVTVPTPAVCDEDSDLAMLRNFLSKHTAGKAAKAAEATANTTSPAVDPVVSPSPPPSAPILAANTPERRLQGIWADTPAFSITSSASKASPAVSTGRKPLGVLDANSPSPKKAKRKADDVEEREPSPEKQPPKRTRRAKEDKPEAEKKDSDAEEKPNETPVPPPVPGVRTRAQRAAERGEAPPATRIAMRHQGYAKVRNGEKDLATLTRQNTRANKGSALPADEVLEKLKTNPPAVETRAARRNGKSVQWAEKLARSQSEEPQTMTLSPEEEKEVGKATKPKAKATTTKRAAATTTTTKTAPKTAKATSASKLRQPAAATTAASGPKTEGAKVTKKVTAAKKKELGLSANGTPAKRSARIAEKK
ncbi:hypothetical protein CPLU01_12786 [Colletotrichum plurivorum]|uniref:Uncharacterized protein n=1 Tax=Colletotrichum plurivorum TaxID=2175906 RepID=A0A8H6N4R5_9PEZI|nr:hypothetical protein CPLU01_12786 [Colletotrichum plurivorum]